MHTMDYSELHTKAYLVYTHTFHTHHDHSFPESTSQLCTLELQEEFLPPNQHTTCECSYYSCVCDRQNWKMGTRAPNCVSKHTPSHTQTSAHTYINTQCTPHTHTSLSPDEGLHDLGVGSLVELQFLVVKDLGICSAVHGTLPQEGGVQCQVTLGEGPQSVNMLYSNGTNRGLLV